MAFYNAVTSTAVDENAIYELLRFEPSGIQSVLIFNAGADTVYIGTSETTATTGFPLTVDKTLSISWLDFMPGSRTTDNVVIYGTCAAGKTATIWVYGFMRQVH